jgi:hypothetical protein
MKFQRNYERIRGGSFGRRVILLTLAVGGMIGFFVLLTTKFTFYKAPPPIILSLAVLEDDLFLVDKDTTNFEKLASVLRKEIKVLRKKERPIEIWVQLPKSAKVGDISEVVMLATAFDGVKMRLKSER